MFPSPIPTPAPSPSPAAIAEIVEFVIVSPLCLASVSAKGTTLQQLIDPGVDNSGNPLPRESAYPIDGPENLLLWPPTPEANGPEPYGEACTDNTDAVFREKDVVEFTFTIVEREPGCQATNLFIHPWDTCPGDMDAAPVSNNPIAIQVADAVSGIEKDSDT